MGLFAMRSIEKYRLQYGVSPSFAAFTQLLEDECSKNSVNLKESAEYLKRLSQLPVVDLDYAVDKIVTFCRERATLNAIKTAAKFLKEGKLPESGFTQMFEQALDVGQNLDDYGYL